MSLPNAVIVPHGATEAKLAGWLMRELKTVVVIHRPYETERAVSMKDIQRILSEKPFDRTASLHSKYPSLDYDERRRCFRKPTVIPVLDVDADRRTLGSYRSGDLFRDFAFGMDAVLPIYNDPNIEAVLKEAGFGDVRHNLGSFQEALDGITVRSSATAWPGARGQTWN